MSSCIESLPDEMLLSIFGYVSAHELSLAVAPVCRRWSRLVEALVARPPGSLAGARALLVPRPLPGLSSGYLVSCALRADCLQELTICRNYALDLQEYSLLRSMKHLKHLDVFAASHVLSDKHVPQGTLRRLVVNNSMGKGYLKTLAGNSRMSEFHMYGRSDYYIEKEMVHFLRVQSAHLRELTLRCAGLVDAQYAALRQCTRLVALRLYACALLTGAGAAHVTSPPLLRVLHLTGTHLVRKTALGALLEQLPPLLQELNLSRSHLRDELCARLARAAPRLRRLELWRCPLTARGVMELVSSMSRLQELDTDVLLAGPQLAQLGAHAQLERVRCRRKDETAVAVGSEVRVTSAAAVVRAELLRQDAQGPSSELFYYWTCGLAPLATLDTTVL